LPIELDPSFPRAGWASQKGVAGEIRGAILAAGLGRRMEPLTARYLPKPLFPLGGKLPIAEVWVRRMVASGITDLTMNLCVLKETLKAHFGDGAGLGAHIAYVEEDVPSGTLGGVCKQALGAEAKPVRDGEPMPALAAFAGSTLIVPSGDIVTNFGPDLLAEMHDLHRRAGAALSMVLVPVPWERRKDYGTVVLDRPDRRPGALAQSGRIGEFREKDPGSPSNLNNASIYMVEMELLKTVDPLRTEARADAAVPFYDFGKHLFPAMLGRLAHITLPKDFLLWGVEYDGAWFDVGQKRDYLRVNEEILDGRLDAELPYERTPWGYRGNDVAIDLSRVRIVPPVVLGNGCAVEPGATLGPYAVIGDGWTLEAGCRVRNSVLWERYAVWNDDGGESPLADRERLDPHRVGRGVTVAESIIAGGDLRADVIEQTVGTLADGELEVLPIDWVPSGPRA